MPGEVEVQIKEQRPGRRYSHITADLYQKVGVSLSSGEPVPPTIGS